jgi:hypothetical protein
MAFLLLIGQLPLAIYDFSYGLVPGFLLSTVAFISGIYIPYPLCACT